MPISSTNIIKTYLSLSLLSTFAASFIWGINTLFLLSAGLSITQAFAANAFFTIGQVIFEIPTGVIADTIGRRFSYLTGTITLFFSTVIYIYLWQIQGPFWGWALSSVLLGLGFTFFSGATEAWLVDGLNSTDFKGTLDEVFAKGQVATGIAMLSGTISGGLIAQFTNLGVPYVLRCVVLLITFVVAYLLMHDQGFIPRKSKSIKKEVKLILSNSLKFGLNNPPVRWLMLSGPFVAGVSYYGFYAMQPYLLELYGNSSSYAIAGLAAAIVAGAQIFGGLSVKHIAKLFAHRTSLIIFNTIASSIVLILIGLFANFWLVLILISLWGILYAASQPVRQSYINGLIPSSQRATVLSSDNLLSSSGAAVLQPGLGKSADVYSYSLSYVLSGFVSILAVPLLLLAKKHQAKSDSFNH